METLLEILRSDPQTSVVDLEFQQISSINGLLPKLAELPNMRQLSLLGNRLEDLPQNLSCLKVLESLDISNNMIQSIASVLPGLKSLPNLKSLTITLRDKVEEDNLIKELSRLEVLNGASIRLPERKMRSSIQAQKPAFSSEQDDMQLPPNQKPNEIPQFEKRRSVKGSGLKEEITLKQEDLEGVAIIYDLIRELQREFDNDLDKSLADQFDEHVRNVMLDLSNKLKPELPAYVVNSNITKAKYALFELCFMKLIDFSTTIDPRLVSILEGIHDAHAMIFKDMSSIISMLLNSHNQDKEKFKEAEKVLEFGEKMEKENSQQLLQEKEEMQQELKSLEEENKRLLDLLIRHSKGEKASSFAVVPTLTQEEESVKRSAAQKGVLSEQEDFSNFNVNQTYLNNLASEKPASQSQKDQFRSSKEAAGTVSALSAGGKTLTLKQLKDFIEEIYESKMKFDAKLTECKLPKETMEQHMYSFLNQKYGLKSLIIEWATSIINGIRKYSQEDNDVAVFGKLLRNECDEEFRFVQGQVKNTISELLKMYLRGKYPFKHNAEIKEILESKVNGFIYEEESNDIIKYMYNQSDAESLLAKLREQYSSLSQKTFMKDNVNKKLSREEQLQLIQEKEKPKIEFLTFQKIILDFQLKSHEKFLRKFIRLFRGVDKDNNGIIDEREFTQLLASMDIGKEQSDVHRLLQIVDPYNNQQITFSQCVALFSAELISKGNATFSILQKLSMESNP